MLRHPHLALGREGIVILTAYYILVYYTLSDLGDLSNMNGFAISDYSTIFIS